VKQQEEGTRDLRLKTNLPQDSVKKSESTKTASNFLNSEELES